MTLEDALSDQRGEHLLHKHSSVMAIRLSLGPQDGWVWEGTPPLSGVSTRRLDADR